MYKDKYFNFKNVKVKVVFPCPGVSLFWEMPSMNARYCVEPHKTTSSVVTAK